MKAAEIALRQEIRQMLNEAGINKESLKIMAREVMNEEIQKQVKNAFSQTNVKGLIYNNYHYELRDAMKEAIQREIKDSMNIKINIDVNVDEEDKT